MPTKRKPPKDKTPKRNGRPPLYNEEIAVQVLVQMMSGKSVRQICKQEGFPSRDTVHVWIATNAGAKLDKEEKVIPGTGFSDRYAHARKVRAAEIFDEMEEIADDGTNDWMERNGKDNPGWTANGENVQRSRLRIDTRKWMLSKMEPNTYGDKLELSGNAEKPLTYTFKTVYE